MRLGKRCVGSKLPPKLKVTRICAHTQEQAAGHGLVSFRRAVARQLQVLRRQQSTHSLWPLGVGWGAACGGAWQLWGAE